MLSNFIFFYAIYVLTANFWEGFDKILVNIKYC